MLPSHVHPPEGDQEHESPNLGVTWHVGRGWPKSGCAGSLVGVRLAGGRGGETPQTGFLASGAACLTSPRPSASSCNNMRSSSGCTMPTREGYTSLPVRGSQPGRTGGTPVSLCRGACLGPQGGGEAGPGFRVWVMAILIMRGLPALSSFEQIPSAPPRPDSEAARRLRLWVAVGGKPLGVLA